MARKGKTAPGAFRPLGMVKRWKLRHAYKGLRSHFHSVRQAALREIHQILQPRRGAGCRAGRHAPARKTGGWLTRAWRKLWGNHGWQRTDPSPVRQMPARSNGVPLPIRQAQAQGGRAPARTGPVLTGKALRQQAREARQASKPQEQNREHNIQPGRHEGGYVYETPSGPLTSDKPMNEHDLERAARGLAEYKAKAERGEIKPGDVYHTNDRETYKDGRKVASERTAEKVLKGQAEAVHREVTDRQQAQQDQSRENGHQARGRHAKPEPAPDASERGRTTENGRAHANGHAPGRERFKQAAAPVRSASNPGHEYGLAAPAGTPHGRDTAPPLPADRVREAPSRSRSR